MLLAERGNGNIGATKQILLFVKLAVTSTQPLLAIP